MQGIAVKEHRVARRETRRHGRAEYRRIVRAIGAEELRVVEPIGVERHSLGARHEPQRPVVDRFFAEREPERNKILALERPETNIAMPAGLASIAWMLGHEAVVMRARDQ